MNISKRIHRDKKSSNLPFKLLAGILLLLLTAKCSDSERPVGPGQNGDSKIAIQGSISGPIQLMSKLSESETQEILKGSEFEYSKNIEQDLLTSEIFTNAQVNKISGEVLLIDITVFLYEFSDFIINQNEANILASVTTDEDGRYTIPDIEEDLDLVIVTESHPRLTLIIMGADDETTRDINSATAVVSEYWAGEIANGRAFDQNNYEEMLQIATDLLGNLSAEELFNVLDELIPELFGDGFPGNLSSEARHFVNVLTGFDFAACENIELEFYSGKPTNYVLINGISSEFGEEPLGWVYDSNNIDDENRFGVYIERLNGNQAQMLIPLHPSSHIGGGSAIIEIYDENQSIICSGISFEIEALANAPGTIKQMVVNLEGTFQNITQHFGYNHDELLTANVADLPDEAKALAASIQTIGGPNNPNSIQQILSGDAPILEGEMLDAEVLQLFDALMNESGLSEKVLEFDEIFDSQAKLMNSSSSGNCFVLPENISTPGELNCWMGVQAWFENANQGLAREMRDLTGATMGVGAVVALATGVGAPLAAVLGMSATAVTMMHIFIDANDNTLPSQLLGFEIWGNPAIYENEDDDTEGVWSADLAAQSNGWTLDWATTIGNVPGLGKVAGIFNKTGMPNAAEFLLQNFQREINNVWEADSGPIDLAPQIHQFTIDNNRDKDFVSWELNTTSQETNIDPFYFTQDEEGYTPEAVGTAELRVETKGGDVFKGQKVFNFLELEVESIGVTLAKWMGPDFTLENESPYYIDVNEEFALEARVSNALNTDVQWSVSASENVIGGLSFLQLPDLENVMEVIANEPGRYTLKAESIADTGPRADNTPPRFDQVTLVVGGLIVSSPGCVETGETYQLSARIGGESISFNELEWDITGSGSIDSNGLYTAGGTGEVQIHFQVIDQPQLTDTISFSVNEMCRSFSLNSSEFSISGGDCVFFTEDVERGHTTISFNWGKIPTASLSIMNVLSDIMPPDDDWSVEQPGWILVSVIRTDLTPLNNMFSFTNENGEASNFELSQELREINGVQVRTLSGYMDALHQYTDSSGEERTTHVSIHFTGAPFVASASHIDWEPVLVDCAND